MVCVVLFLMVINIIDMNCISQKMSLKYEYTYINIYRVFKKYRLKIHPQIEKSKIERFSRMTIGLKLLRFRPMAF